MMLWKTSYFMITIALFFWRGMVSRKVEREQKILTYDFFVTDRIKKGEVTVYWCQIYDMTGDLFTKPNQGSLFRRFRDMIMGVVRQLDPGKGNNIGI